MKTELIQINSKSYVWFNERIIKEIDDLVLVQEIYSQLKEIEKWKTADLDLILACVDKTYKDLSVGRILSVEDFANEVEIR